MPQPVLRPPAGKKWPVQMNILSLIIAFTNLLLIITIIIFSQSYIHNTVLIRQKVELIEIYNELKRSHLYCHLALGAYAETGQQGWLDLFRDKKHESEASLKKALTVTNDSFLRIKLSDINALHLYLDNFYAGLLALLENRNNYRQVKAVLNDVSYLSKLNLLYRNIDSLSELDSSAYSVQKVISKIRFLNDNLRLIIRFAVLMGSAHGEAQYNKAEGELTFLFRQAVLLTREADSTQQAALPPWFFTAFGSQATNNTDTDTRALTSLEDANNNLVRLEREAFAAIEAGKTKEAFTLIAGKEYGRYNELYQDGLKNLGKVLESKGALMLREANNDIAAKLIILALLLVISAVVWYFTFYVYRRLYVELLGSKQKLEDMNFTLEKKVAESTREIIRRSFADELTKLPNRLKLDRDLHEDKWRALAIINIDNFSNYKAAFGPSLANMALQAIAERLSRILSDKGNLYKLSYDEFAFLCNDLEIIASLLYLITSQINKQPITVEDIQLHVSVGIGVVMDEEAELLRKANLALINAKKCGPCNLMIYKPEFDITREYKNNIEWIKKVQAALEEDMIVPFFQGIRDNKTGRINKYECLMRIKAHDQIVPPASFLEPARQAGLLPRLTERMLDKTLPNFKHTPFDFSFNISKEDLLDANFIKLITRKINAHSISSERITFEILENMSFERNNLILEDLKTLKELGFKLAIDDFGTAYSNFTRLVDMNIDFLKIDGSFIKNIDKSERSLEIVKSITSFCHNLNIKLVAEFVHAESVQTIVEGLGIDYSQGYYFSVPRETML